MSTKQLPNYLRTYRKRACLSQDEVAYLLWSRTSSKISRYENNSRLPTPETVFVYEVLFMTPVQKLFGGRHAIVAQKTRARIHRLERRLVQRKPTPINQRKIELLRAALSASRTKTSKHS